MPLILDGTLGVSGVDGTAGTPSLQGTDSNTGVFYATDIVGIATNGTERMRIDSSGNVGIGTTVDPFSTGLNRSVSIGAGSDISVGLNISSSGGSRVQLGIGSTRTFILYSDSANFTSLTTTTALPMLFQTNNLERMRITSAGNVGIGTTAPTTQLEIKSAQFTDSEITLDNTSSNTTSRVLFKAAGTEYGRISGDSTQVTLQAGNIPMVFRTNSAERMRIDSSGNVLIATTSATPVSGITASGQVVMAGARAFLGTSVGGDTVLGGTAGSNFTDLYVNGVSGARFNLSGSVVLKGGFADANGTGITFPATQSASSDANTLDDYEEGTFTPTNANVSLTANEGRYTKIGRVVQWACSFGIPSTADATSIRIDGLPFTSGNTNAARAGSSVGYTDYGSAFTVMVDSNATSFYFYSYAGANLTLANLSTKTIYCGGTYTV